MMEKTNYAVMDIEGITLWLNGEDQKPHNCLRKVAVLLSSNEHTVFEAHPCVPYANLTNKEIKTYEYCYDYIHGLEYYPPETYQPFIKCENIPEIVKDYLDFNKISMVYYKGGCLEKNLCEKIGFKCFNLEKIGVPKASNHNPLEEVIFYKEEFERICGD